MSTEQNKELGHRLYAAVSTGDYDAIDQLVVPNFVEQTMVAPGMPEGREGLKALFRMIRQAMPDMVMIPEDIVAEGYKIAGEKNISVKEMNRLAEKGPEIDYLIDDAQKALAKEGSGIFEGRLSGHLLSADLKVLLKADLRTRAERIAKREAKLTEDAMQETRIREESEARRYKMYYNIDISDFSAYDLVVDTGKFDEAATQAIVLAAVRARQCP